ncbi:MAG: M6 family metalloprotease domain-containing protein [Aigarchaeota archaeon]|nr:M6 family metalloprotease domain-containing protein [Candidatus Pelearchaeum maunauluense]
MERSEQAGIQLNAVYGTRRVLVIPVDFPDIPTPTSLNEAVSSGERMADYWLEVSYGVFTTDIVRPDTWITVSQSSTYYGDDIGSSIDARLCQLINEAFQLADPLFDLRAYDYFIIVHARNDQAMTGNEYDIWSSAYYSPRLSCGLRLPSGEETSIDAVGIVSIYSPMGTWAHEVGHLIGLPDLYNTAQRDEPDNFVGPWDLMAAGSWNGPLSARGSSPAHLTSWGKIKLGWLADERVRTVTRGESAVITLSPLETGDGMAAIKIPITSSFYYLIELRKKIGYDRYLPSAGVLILVVDESKPSGGGIVKVVRKSGQSLNNAALDVGEKYVDEQRQITIKIISKTLTTFTVSIEYGVITYELKLVSNIPGINIRINGTIYTVNADGIADINLPKGKYILSVPDIIPENDSSRYVFLYWVVNGERTESNEIMINVADDMLVEVFFKRQYRVTIDTPFGRPVGAGWHDEGTSVVIGVDPAMLVADYGNATRYVFSGWLESSFIQPLLEVTINQPITLTAFWKKQYYVDIREPLASVKSGWYDANTRLTITITEQTIPVEVGERLVFRGWSGDINATSTEIEVVVDSPKLIEARWVTQYRVIVNATPAFSIDKWMDAGEELEISVPSILQLSPLHRLVFAGWTGYVEQGQNITLTISSPIETHVNWIEEYLTSLRLVDLRGQELPEKLNIIITLKRDDASIELQPPYSEWLQAGSWVIESAEVYGIELGLGNVLEVDKPVVAIVHIPLAPLSVYVMGERGQPLSGATVKVKVDGARFADTTGKDGVITIGEVPARKLSINVEYKGLLENHEIGPEWTETGSVNIVMPVYLELFGVPFSGWQIIIMILVVSILLLVITLIVFVVRRRRRKYYYNDIIVIE